MKIKSRHYARRDATKTILQELELIFGYEIKDFMREKTIEIVKTEEQNFVFVDGEPLFFIVNGKPFPTVKGALSVNLNKRKVVVDKGAVKFVSKGADVMCPGIVYADPKIKKDDLVIVVEETHGKALAIGRALINGESMIAKKGKAIKTIHYVGDKIWNFEYKY